MDLIEKRDKVAFVSHCILNQATRAWWEEGGASRERGMVSDVVDLLMRHGVGTIQMGCPEFSLYGNPRPPCSWEEYNTPEFKEKCREMAIQTCEKMETLTEREAEPVIEITAILGFEGSPSCGVERTTRTIRGERRRAPGRGHLIEALRREMKSRGLQVTFLGVSLREDERRDALRKLRAIVTDDIP
jgi:predicted secreted protein